MTYQEAVAMLGWLGQDAAERWTQTDPLLSDIDARALARESVLAIEKAIWDRGWAAGFGHPEAIQLTPAAG